MDTNERVTWNDFGLILQRIRERLGLSQARLALLLGCHRSYIWRLEHSVRSPSTIFLRSLTHIGIATPDELRMIAVFARMRADHCAVIEDDTH